MEQIEPQKSPRGQETVVVAEDDAGVRVLAARMLRLQGYLTLEAGNAATALSLITSDAEKKIRLLLTDLIMPDGGGQSLADRVKAVRADIKVIFISGHTDQIIEAQGLRDPSIPLLRKPFTHDQLARLAREALDS